ncbi:hypothetical protein B6A27_11330 [Anoxybacillus sp. UARK-01]|nr:hypothetical protein B6A27_11330 [Anoxybacillus sp. UARK-01]
MHAYGIDLFEQHGKLHWKKFLQLLQHLDDKSKFKEVVNIRKMPMPKPDKYNTEYRKQIAVMKRIYALDQPDKQEILGDFENGQLAAKVHLLPFTVFIHEQEWEMGGVAGVATWPEHRRKRKVAKLLTKSLERMRESGKSISFLHPFQVNFYRRFGWELFASYKKLIIENKQLVPLPEAAGRMERASLQNVDLLNSVYEGYIRSYNGGLKRDHFWWEHFVFAKAKHAVLYIDKDHQTAGYLLYDMQNRQMHVKEMVALHEEAKRGLWNFICQHDSMADQVTIVTAVDDPLPYLLKEPRIVQEIHPYFMARIVDLERFLQAYPFVKQENPLFWHVHDEVAPWNSAIYQLDEKGVKVFRKTTKEESTCLHPPKRGLLLDINTAAALLLGYVRPWSLYQMGKLKGTEAEVKQLEAMISPKPTFFADFF